MDHPLIIGSSHCLSFFLLVLHTLLIYWQSSLPFRCPLWCSYSRPQRLYIPLSLRPRLFSQRTVSLCGLPAKFTSTRPNFSSNLLLPLHVHPPTKPSFSWVITRSALVLWHLLRPSSARLSAWLKICTGMPMIGDALLKIGVYPYLYRLETRRVMSVWVWLCHHGVGRVYGYVQQNWLNLIATSYHNVYPLNRASVFLRFCVVSCMSPAVRPFHSSASRSLSIIV